MKTIYTDGHWLRNYLQTILNDKKIYQTWIRIFIKNYSDNSDKGYIFEVDAKHPKQ